MVLEAMRVVTAGLVRNCSWHRAVGLEMLIILIPDLGVGHMRFTLW